MTRVGRPQPRGLEKRSSPKELIWPNCRIEAANTNYVLLGLIVESATGRSLSEVVRTSLLDPLHMDRTFSSDEAGAVIDMGGYIPIGDTMIDASGVNLSISWAVGGLVSTAEDVASMVRGIFESDLLSIDSRKRMTSGFIERAGTPVRYAHGTILFDFIDPAPIGHSGEGPGFSSVAVWGPDSGAIVVILTNIQTEALFTLLAEIADLLSE
mgnify:CR=1 FL=1